MENKCVIYFLLYILGEAPETAETTKSFFGDPDDEDRRLFNEEFIRKSIGEADDDVDSLYCEQVHCASQDLWDDLLEENVLEDLDESNFPGVVEANACESFNSGRTLMLLIVELKFCYSFFTHSLLFYQSASHGCPFLSHPFHQVCIC